MKAYSRPAAPPPSAPPPPAWRDPWSWLVAASVLPLFFVGRGTPFGEAVLDDFDYLYETLFRTPVDWLSGWGSPLFWRPVSRQIYYLIVTPFAAQHPEGVAILQAGLLALAGVLLYRALRPAWSAPLAAAAATIPLALEASVQIVTYSSCAQDLLALVFGAASLLALSRGRSRVALLWLALALFSKENAVAFAAAMPLWPAMVDGKRQPAGGRVRARIAAEAGALAVAWWLLHEWVMSRGGFVSAPRIAGASPIVKFIGALAQVAREALNANDHRSRLAPWALAAALLVTVIATAVALATPPGRMRLRAAAPWFAWAVFWVGVTTLPIAWYMPTWGSYRALSPVFGLGIAGVALLRSAGRWAVLLVVAARLVALLGVPPVPTRIPLTFEGTNIEFDLVSLASVQQFAHAVRVTVMRERPVLPHGATIVCYQWPRMSTLAFSERKAFRVWYRDSTLRVVGMAELQQAPFRPVDLAVEFEPSRSPQVALIAPRALQAVLLAADSLRHGRAGASERLLADFERLQPDTNAAVFMATGLALRGAALLAQEHVDEAAAALQSALHSNADDPNAHRLLAEVHVRRGRPDLAILELRRHLAVLPQDAEARQRLGALTHARP